MSEHLPRRSRARFSALPVSMRAFVIATLASFVLSGIWAFASPLMSVPDEPSHAIKAAAVVRGELGGVRPDGEGVGAQTLEVQVPVWLAKTPSLVCYAFQPAVTADCAEGVDLDGGPDGPVSTTAGNYNPVFYAYAGLPSLWLSDEPALYAMRLVCALVSSVFLGGMFAALAGFSRRWWTMAAAAVSVTPMVLYLGGAINPNSLEFATTGAMFANLVLLVRRREAGLSTGAQIAWVTAAGVLLANSKGSSLAWMLVAVLVAFTLAGWGPSLRLFRDPRALVGIVILAAGTVFAIWWILSRDALSSGPYPSAGTPLLVGFAFMLVSTFEYASGIVGLFGWLDTPSPSWVLLAWGAAIGAITVVAVAMVRGRRLIAVLIAAGALVLVPVVIQAAVVTEQGYLWQGRYNLALFVVFMLAAGMAVDHSRSAPRALPTPIARVTLVLLATGHVAAFVWTLRRYVIGEGTGAPVWTVLTAPQWQPPLGLVALSLLFAVATAATAGTLWPRREAALDGTGGNLDRIPEAAEAPSRSV